MKKGNNIISKIAKKAKEIRKKGETWQAALKRATKIINK
jgi:hypothetical protein